MTLSRTCPAGPADEPLTRMATRLPGMGGTGLEPAPPPNDTARHRATDRDENPLPAAGFRLPGATNRDTARHRATAPARPICPEPVQPAAEWLPVRTSDWRLRALRDRHYAGGVGGRTAGPPGRRLALVTFEGTAGWISAWPDPRYTGHGLGDVHLCTLFRNEGAGLSSLMILDALARTELRWGPAPDGWATFVDEDEVRPKRDPGYCFIRAGFEPAGRTKDRDLLILRRGSLAEAPA